jgi:hypothetical protein
MTTTASTPLPTPSPDLPAGEAQSEAPRNRGRFSRGLVAATVGLVVAITGAVFWLTAGSSGSDTPGQQVQVVDDGRWGGPDVYEHGRQPDGSFGTADQQQFGSADSLEHHASPQAE